MNDVASGSHQLQPPEINKLALRITGVHLLVSLLLGAYLFAAAFGSALGPVSAGAGSLFFVLFAIVALLMFTPLFVLHWLNAAFLHLDIPFIFVLLIAVGSSFLYGYGLAAFYRAWSQSGMPSNRTSGENQT